MGDPTPSGPLGITTTLRDILKRLRNLEKAVRRRLTVTGLSASGSVSAGGDVTGANLAAYSGVTGLFVTAALAVKGLTGEFTNGLRSPGVRTTTLTNSPVQLYVDADGNLGVGASTKAKKNIGTDYKVDMTKFLAVVLKNWTYKDNPLAAGMGPIADDLDAAGLKEFVIYNLDGSIQGVRSDMLIIGLWSAYVQSRTATLAEFDKRMVQTVTNSAMTLLGINAERTYDIAWPKEFADTNYAVSASVTSSGLALAAVCAVVPGSKTVTGCKITVRSLGIVIAANSTLTVEAIHV